MKALRTSKPCVIGLRGRVEERLGAFRFALPIALLAVSVGFGPNGAFANQAAPRDEQALALAWGAARGMTAARAVNPSGPPTRQALTGGDSFHASQAGLQGHFSDTYTTGNLRGTLTVDYEMYDQPDALTVQYGNRTLWATGMVSDGGARTFYLDGNASSITLVVDAPAAGTGWGWSMDFVAGQPRQPTPRPERYEGNWLNLVADPVNATTGAFYQDHVDLELAGPFPIQVRRTYSSRGAYTDTEFGYGWSAGYASCLVLASDLSTIQATSPDGSVVTFRRQGSSDLWIPSLADNPEITNAGRGATNPLNSSITRTTGGDGVTRYQWQLPNGHGCSYSVRSFPVTVDGTVYPRQQAYVDSWQDDRGNTLTFTFGTDPADGSYGNIRTIRSSNGRTVTFDFNPRGNIVQATASDGRTVAYHYTELGELASVQLADGNIWAYQYASGTHLIALETKPDGRLLKNFYDATGRVIEQQATVDQSDPTLLVRNASFDYSVAGRTTISDAYNYPTVYEYTQGMVTRIVDPLGQTITQTWYMAPNVPAGGYPNSLQSVTDKRGLVTTYQYDARGNVTQTQITGELDGDPATTAESRTVSGQFNSLNLPVTTTDANGITATYTYGDPNYPYLPSQIVTAKDGTTPRTDAFTYTAQSDASTFSKGLMASRTLAAGSPDQAVTTWVYNAAGLVMQQTVQTGTTDPDLVSTFTYTARGELLTATDGDGRSIIYAYDGMSRPTARTVKDENGTVLGTWAMTYTGNGELSRTSGPRSAPVNSIDRTYDGAGRLTEEAVALSQAKADGTGVMASPDFAITSYAHDHFGNLVLRVDPMGNVTTMTYDAIGQLRTRSTAGLRSESFEYEAGGQVSVYTNPLGGVTRNYYTSTGQLRRQENADGSVLQWRYGPDGRLQQEVLRNGAKWTTVYDDVARSVTRTFTNAAGTVLATEIGVYDRRSHLVSHTDGEGYVSTTAYDGADRVKSSSGPAGVPGSAQQVTTFTYGASARTTTTQNGLGEREVRISDALGRPEQIQIRDAGNALVRVTAYTYSADHSAVTVTEGSGSSAITEVIYSDTQDRTVLSRRGDGSFTRYAFDLNGRPLSAVDALGRTTSYSYNGLGQLITQTLPDGNLTSFTYDAAGNLLTRSMAGGTLTEILTYDPAGRKLTARLTSGVNSTRQYSYGYYPSGSPAAGLLQSVTGPRDNITTVYDDFLRPQVVTTAGVLPETNGSTTYGYDRRSLPTTVSQSSTGGAAGPATVVDRIYDSNAQIVSETVTVAGVTHAAVTQTWNAAARRSSLDEASSSLPAPLFAYQYRADGRLTQTTANGQNYGFTYGDHGLLTARTNAFRTLAVTMRDATGRIQEQTQAVGGAEVLAEDMIWRANGTLGSYSATRNGGGGWIESRLYSYNSRDQLLSEGFAPTTGALNALNFRFDGPTPGLGIRLEAKIGTGAPASWQTSALPDSLGRVTADQVGPPAGHAFTATGSASGADHVDLLVDGVPQGRATYSASTGTWSRFLDLAAGSHTLTANAVDASGLYAATATSTFTVTGANPSELAGTIASAYDDEGNVTSRTWSTGQVQTLKWDAFGRLIQVAQRDANNNGYDWTAVYDGLGRRLKTAQQPLAAGVPAGAATILTSIYDPQVEFLEIGLAVNGANAWKVYGPDLNGSFGALQGTGGLEATVLNADGTTKGVVNDQFGNGVASVSGSAISWSALPVSASGPLPGTVPEILTDVTRLADATVWRSHRLDPTGLIYLGARYYEPTSSRFLSADPMGHAASPSLYDYAGGDPVNRFDPDGRFGKQMVNTLNEDGPFGLGAGFRNLSDFYGRTAQQRLADGSDLAAGIDYVGQSLFGGLSSMLTPNAHTDRFIQNLELHNGSYYGAFNAQLNPAYMALTYGAEASTGYGYTYGNLGSTLSGTDRLLSGVNAFNASVATVGTGMVVTNFLSASGATASLERWAANKDSEFVNLANKARTEHILDGEVLPNGKFGGGHRSGTGFPGKSEFPATWSDDEIMHHISDVATDPLSTSRPGRAGDIFLQGTRKGVDVEVLIRKNEIWTGYPTNVPRNP